MLSIGFAAADITPDPGMQMPGGFYRAVGKGVRDKLYASACVVSSGANSIALVGTDTLEITKECVTAARRMIRTATGIPDEAVLVGANHTHTGGPILVYSNYTDDPVYTDRVTKAIAAAVIDAWKAKAPAEVGVGTGREASISFNRRFLMKDGREITHPGRPGTPHHGAIVRPAGPIDPDVGVLAARDVAGKVTGVVVNFACHSTVVGGDQFHPDYAGYLRKHLRERFGPTCGVVFLLGCCGDITQVDNFSNAPEFGPAWCDMMGMKLASETARTIGRLTWLKDAPVAAHVETIPIAVRPDPDVDRERPAFGLGGGPDVEKFYASERAYLADFRKQSPIVPCEVQALRVGPLGIATNGAEYFVEYGLRIKECSPFQPTWVVSLANESLGYVPTAQAMVAGGYEPRTNRFSKLEIGAGQRLVEGALKALKKLG